MKRILIGLIILLLVPGFLFKCYWTGGLVPARYTVVTETTEGAPIPNVRVILEGRDRKPLSPNVGRELFPDLYSDRTTFSDSTGRLILRSPHGFRTGGSDSIIVDFVKHRILHMEILGIYLHFSSDGYADTRIPILRLMTTVRPANSRGQDDDNIFEPLRVKMEKVK